MASKATALNNVSNNAAFALPYRAEVQIRGISPILFHRWDSEAVESKNSALKGSSLKRSDNWESYLYKNEKGEICIPGLYLHRSLIDAARFWQDPRSPRKSLSDLAKAGIIVSPHLSSTGQKEPDYLDRRRVVVQRNAVTRTRPALLPGWGATFFVEIVLPEYFPPEVMHDLLAQAGKIIGIGDYRPTFGRFQVDKFEILDDADKAAATQGRYAEIS